MSAATLGARLRARREELKLTQRGLADATAGVVSNATIAAIEGGTTPNPGLDKLRALAGAVGWTLDELDGKPAASGGRAIMLKDIEADPDNPRTVDVGNLVDAAFVDSIRTEGLLQAVTVRRSPDAPGKWRIAFGGRRYAALVLIHGPASSVEVATKETDVSGSRLLLQQLVENVQRADMNAMDLAAAVTKLVDAGQDTAALAGLLKKGRRWVQEQASVGHHLTADGQDALRKGVISISQAVALAAWHDEEQQNNLMARAGMQGLNEEEIRAIIADAKVKDAEAKAAEDAKTQPSLIMSGEPSKPGHYPRPDEFGVFPGDPTFEAHWTHKRGDFEVQLVQFGDHKWAGAVSYNWRAGVPGGGGQASPVSRQAHVQQTAALSFLSAARDAYVTMRRWSNDRPEDIPAMRELHAWIAGQLKRLEATPRVINDWMKNSLPPDLPRAQRPAGIARQHAPPKPAEKPLTKADVLKLPAWAKPLKLSHFVIIDEGKATLVKSWAKMAAVMWSIHEISEECTLRDLGERRNWQDDTRGAPFDFGSIVYRITDMKAR